MTSPHLAVLKSSYEIAATLFKHGADVNAIYLKLSIAAKRGNVQLLKLLLEKCGDINVVTDSDYTPLQLAAQFGHYEIAKTLFCECNTGDKIKASHIATFNGYKRIVELSVKEGVNVNATCASDKNVLELHFAALAGYTEIINFLIANGCDINVIGKYDDED
ncbi:hypothetical protein AVEN_177898-1 [Araneus ventricosus]|uniref:Alpha-latrotoxin n=1 Tax=Araneus ventricosus TaxID=182803 RepID=A0A4Y2KDV9_ARAVE|nr:hypothetical protein AVEN_177898-1 [Araneus ventricosus]